MKKRMKGKKRIHHIYGEDFFQLVFGALAFGVPAAFTQETWELGETLGSWNYLLLIVLSVTIIALAVFHTGYHTHSLKTLEQLYLQRICLSYLIIFMTCAVFLTLISRAPWFTDPFIALQRVIIIGVPATISGITADLIK